MVFMKDIKEFDPYIVGCRDILEKIKDWLKEYKVRIIKSI